GGRWRPGCRGALQILEKCELVSVMGIGQAAPVWHIYAPHVDGTAISTNGPCLDHRLLVRLAKTRLVRKAQLDVAEANARRDSHAIPLIETVDGNFVARGDKRGHWELVWLTFDFLHGQHVRFRLHQPVDDAWLACPNRVHVPGGDPHCTTVPLTAWNRRGAQLARTTYPGAHGNGIDHRSECGIGRGVCLAARDC